MCFFLCACIACKVDGTKAMNFATRSLYRAGYWIPSSEARRIAMAGMAFLQSYAKCASIAHTQGLNRFQILPKLHMLHHCFQELLWMADIAAWAINPLGESCQQGEDFIGHSSRLSRTVNIKKHHAWRTLQRQLVLSKLKLDKLCPWWRIELLGVVDRSPNAHQGWLCGVSMFSSSISVIIDVRNEENMKTPMQVASGSVLVFQFAQFACPSITWTRTLLKYINWIWGMWSQTQIYNSIQYCNDILVGTVHDKYHEHTLFQLQNP